MASDKRGEDISIFSFAAWWKYYLGIVAYNSTMCSYEIIYEMLPDLLWEKSAVITPAMTFRGVGWSKACFFVENLERP